MKIGVIGSRTFTNYELLKDKLLILINLEERDAYTIISGRAQGADSLAEEFAEEFKIDTKIYKPDWNKYGKKAGFLRNVDIVKDSDIIFCFWNRVSAGTRHSINLAKKMKKDTVIIYV